MIDRNSRVITPKMRGGVLVWRDAKLSRGQQTSRKPISNHHDADD